MSLLRSVAESFADDARNGLQAPREAYEEAVYVANGLRDGTVSPWEVVKTALLTLTALGVVTALLFPVYWIVVSALNGSGATLYSPGGSVIVPESVSLKPFIWVLGDVGVSSYTVSVTALGYTISVTTPEVLLLDASAYGVDTPSDFKEYFVNSMYVSVFTVLFSMSFIVPAAYALSRREFILRGKILYLYVLFTQVGGGLGIVGLIALYALFNQLDGAFQTLVTAGVLVVGDGNPLWHLLNAVAEHPEQVTVSDNRFVLSLYYAALAVPFNTWLLKTYMDGIPESYEEAAYVDGAPTWRIVVEVIIPLSKAGLATVFIFTFLTGWMEFIVAQTILSPEHYTLPVGLFALTSSQFTTPWARFSAYALTFASPIVLVYLFAQRYIEGGLSFGGMEG